MKPAEKYLFSFYGAALIILSFCMLYMLPATGHQLSIHEGSQMQLTGETFIIFLTAVGLLSWKRNFLFGSRVMIVLLLLAETTLIDIFIELRRGEAENAILVLIMLSILILLNLWVLIVFVRKRLAENNERSKKS
jgi:cytochrome c biogenesis protein CcdA